MISIMSNGSRGPSGNFIALKWQLLQFVYIWTTRLLTAYFCAPAPSPNVV